MKTTKAARIRKEVGTQIQLLQAEIEDLKRLSLTASLEESSLLGARMAGLHKGLGSLILISSKL